MGPMKLLLDTHIFLWWLFGDPRLSRTVSAAIADGSNRLYLSSVSGIEIANKAAVGKLKLPSKASDFVMTGMRQLQMEELAISLRHSYRLAELPMHHRDPFDRLLVAQAEIEGMTLVSQDSQLGAYGVAIIN
ncbi:MAG: hypothetical protein JWN24_2117 [Phycisphaerales bacterium]|nr:hypothetical protein [Phycisphaerales bacterium]